MGGGGGGSSAKFTAQGPPPAFTYLDPTSLNQMAVGADISSYALSDKDFANRYPDLQNAYQQYQANLGQQVGLTAQGQQGQANIMQGLQNQIAGRNAAGTTADIAGIRNAAQTAAGATQPIYNMGAAQAGLAQPLVGMGQQQAGIGEGINRMGGQLAGAAQIPYQLGQQLLNQPMDDAGWARPDCGGTGRSFTRPGYGRTSRCRAPARPQHHAVRPAAPSRGHG